MILTTNNNNSMKNNNNNLESSKRRSNTIVLDKEQAASILSQLDHNSQRTTSLPNFLGTFVQPNLTTTNINNNNTNINNNNKPTITVVQTSSGFHKVVDDDKVDVPMVVDGVQLQQQTAVNLPSKQQLVESVIKSSSENRLQETLENNNRSPKQEDVKPSSPSSSPYIDINSLPMVFDDTKLFQNDHLADTCRHNVSKSQMMDDVLEILIRNGELPASAAHDQTSAGSGVDNSVVNAASDFDIHMDDPFAMDVVCNDDLMMDVDTDWLDSLDLPPPSAEPLADLFNGEATDNDFKLPANMDFLWDRIDFAT